MQEEDLLKQPPMPNGNIMTFDITFRKKNSSLRLGKKIYEFYTAPVTKFWAHTVSSCEYCLLQNGKNLCLFSYIISGKKIAKQESPPA